MTSFWAPLVQGQKSYVIYNIESSIHACFLYCNIFHNKGVFSKKMQCVKGRKIIEDLEVYIHGVYRPSEKIHEIYESKKYENL